MSNKLIQQGMNYSIEKCLTRQCKECSGSYINKPINFKLMCKCKCHEKGRLEQQVSRPACSNTTEQNQSEEQHEELLDD